MLQVSKQTINPSFTYHSLILLEKAAFFMTTNFYFVVKILHDFSYAQLQQQTTVLDLTTLIPGAI